MAVQAKTETKTASSWWEEEATTQKRSSRKGSKPEKPQHKGLLVFGAVALCFLSLWGGYALRTKTTLFLEHRTLDGYLPAEEYVLYQIDDHEPVQKLRTFHYDDYYAFSYYNNYNLETSRGLKPGDSWDDFVDLYGDITCESINAVPVDEDGIPDYDLNQNISIYDPITIRQFHEQYVEPGIIDLSSWYINVDVRIQTDGIHLYYSYQEYNSPFRHILRTYPNHGLLYLSFDFTPNEAGPGTLYYLTSAYYGY